MTATQVLSVGEQLVASVQWSDPTSTTAPIDPSTGFTLVNPTTVTASARDGYGNKITVVVTQSGFVYTARVALTSPGLWYVGFTASGSFTGYHEVGVQVQAQHAV